MRMVVILMATKYVYTCDICNKEAKKSKLHKLEVDNPFRFCEDGSLPYKVYGKYRQQRLEVCNKCYSKLRRYVRKLKVK